MRIRSTKPEFWRSKRIATIEDWSVRLVFKALESYVDDNGVGKDDLALIATDTFPRDMAQDASGTLKRIQAAISTLEQVGMVWRYTVDDEHYLYISFWETAQYINRPTKGRYPRPDGTFNYGDSRIGASNLSPQEDSRALSAGTGEQRNRGTGEQTPSPDPAPPSQADEKFEEFWDAYAKKVGRKKAEQKWRQALKKPDVTPDTLITAATSYVAAQKAAGKHPEFTKDPATWLNGEHWNDEPTNVHQLRPPADPEPGTEAWNRLYQPWMFQ